MQNERQTEQGTEASTNWLNQALVVVTLIAFAVLMKLMPYLLPVWGYQINEADVASYLWHFSPMLPLTLVLGSRYSAKTGALLALLLWFASDLGFLAVTGRFDWVFYAGTPFHYLSILVVAMIGFAGTWLQSHGKLKQTHSIGLTNLFSGMFAAFAFFVVSNFFVWVGGAYPMTFGGLLECYTLALPFHRNDFLSMAIYVPASTWLLFPQSSLEAARESQTATSLTTHQK